MEIASLLGWVSALGTTVVGALLAYYLKDWLDERRERRAERREYRHNHRATDRDTYAHRGVVLLRVNLAAWIGRGWWAAGPDDLDRLLENLEHGNHDHFLDAVVEAAWVKFVQKSLVLARRRRGGALSELELESYHRIRCEFEDAAKRSFGPLPASEPVVPRAPAEPGDDKRAAA